MTDATGTVLSDERVVRAALQRVQADPAAAGAVFRDALHSPTRTPLVEVLAWWGLGRVAHERGGVDDAFIAYTEAVTRALDTELVELAAEVRVSWAACLQAAGDTGAALEQIGLAAPLLQGAALGRALTQRGFLHAVAGDRQAALADYERGLPLLAGADDVAAMRSHLNRGVVLLQMGRFEHALADFDHVSDLATRLDQPALVAGAVHSRAYVHGRLNHAVPALRGFTDARAAYEAIGSLDRHVRDLDIDECELLLDLGLGSNAVPLAERVAAAARDDGDAAQLAEALLMSARALVMADQPALAVPLAEAAVASFEQSGRSAWAALARYWAIVAADSDLSGSPHAILRHFVQMRRVAEQLDRDGWTLEGIDVRVRTGRLALAAKRPDVAAAVLHTAASARHHPLPRVRAEAWHATALLHEANDRRTAAWRALGAGLRAVEQHRASLGSAELRSSAGRFGAPLAATGVRLALAGGRAGAVLEWAERGRAGALGAPEPAGESAVPAELRDRLRNVRRLLAEAHAGGHEAQHELVREATALEAAVSRVARTRERARSETTVMRAHHLRRSLGDDTLLEYVEHDGQLHVVVCSGRALRLVSLGRVADVRAMNDHLAFAVRRLTAMPAGPAAQRAWVAFDAARFELEAALLGPMQAVIRCGSLMVVPTGALHDVLWGALPAAARSGGVALAPSAAWWLHDAPAPRRRSVLLVAGPELEHAAQEVAALHRLYPRAQVLTGTDATVDAVLHGMAAATVVHIAAHGVFRTDNPMFSTLQLHDGSLFVHELEGLRRVPSTVVLTACSSGRSGVLPGDELLGTTAALMGLGVRSVVAPLVPVADAASAQVAQRLHRGMRAGRSAADAMAACLRDGLRSRDGALVAAASSFTCVAARR